MCLRNHRILPKAGKSNRTQEPVEQDSGSLPEELRCAQIAEYNSAIPKESGDMRPRTKDDENDLSKLPQDCPCPRAKEQNA